MHAIRNRILSNQEIKNAQVCKLYILQVGVLVLKLLISFIKMKTWIPHGMKKKRAAGLNFLCVDLHNQCDNVINQCYFIFALWSIMRSDTYCCLIFYGFTLIYLTGPLSQVVQIMCVMCNIYI